jgi:hypothetical protein
MAGIFINYRRDDAPGIAGRLFDYLATKFSRDDLFMDVDAMKPGMDFAKQLDHQVAQCRVLLAVIGPHWFDAKDKSGARRLDSAKDYVRVELASALERDIAVIPILVDGAVLPAEDSLSDDLKPPARRHALELRHTRFAADAEAIVHALEPVVPRRSMLWPLVGAGIAEIVVVGVIAVLWPKLKAKPAAPSPVAVAAQPAPLTPSAVSPPPVQPVAPKLAAPQMQAATPPAASSVLQPPSPQSIKLDEIMNNVAFKGSIYHVGEIADPPACQAACRGDTHCAACTYTHPAAAGAPAHCSLKVVIPAELPDSCCISAVERLPPPELRGPPPVPAGMTGVLPGIELEGGTYRSFNGNDAAPENCRAACRADSQCVAWDYVRPGVISADARCFLKNKPTFQVGSPCCIAGFEQPQAK